MSDVRDRAIRWGSVVALHAAITWAVTFPAMHRVTDHFFGTIRGDKYQFVWIFWWVKRALVDLGQLPFWTPLQYHPTGVSLTLHDMTYFWSLLSVPLQLWMSPETVLNVFLLLSIPLNGIACYALAHHVSRSHWGAVAGSMVFAYCPYLIGRFHVSHVQYLGAFFLPLFLLCLYRYAQTERTRDLVQAGVWAGLTSLVSFYYGIALAAVFAVFVAAHGVARRGELSLSRLGRRAVRQAVAAGLPAALLTLPVIVPALVDIGSGVFGGRISGSSLERGSVDLVAYFVPDRGLAEWRGWAFLPGLDTWAGDALSKLGGNVEERSVYPGWVSWIAVGAALARGRLRRRAWPWIALAAGGLVLTLGPTLHVAGEPYLEGLLPARWMQSIPIVSIVRGPSRFAVFVSLGTAVIVALVLARICEKYGPRRGAAAAAACMLLTAVEFAPRAPFVFPQAHSRSAFYDQMAADADDYAVLNVPVDFRGAVGGGDLYEYAQTVHHKPIVGGYVSREPLYVFETLHESPFLQAVQHRPYADDPRLLLSPEGLAEMPAALERLGVRYVLVHHTELTKPEWRRVTRWLERGPLRRVYQGSQLRAYEVVPAPRD